MTNALIDIVTEGHIDDALLALHKTLDVYARRGMTEAAQLVRDSMALAQQAFERGQHEKPKPL